MRATGRRYTRSGGWLRCLVFVLVLAIVLLAVLPVVRGGASPAARMRRFMDGDNACEAVLDSFNLMLGSGSGSFTVETASGTGSFTYVLDKKNDNAAVYYDIPQENNRICRYILWNSGMQYTFAPDGGVWELEGSRECTTDIERLLQAIRSILAEEEVNLAALEADIDGLFGLHISNVFDIIKLPAAIRSLVAAFETESFRKDAGYSFARDGGSIAYTFAPTDTGVLTKDINDLLYPAYTSGVQTLANLAGFADRIAEKIGFNFFATFLQASGTVRLGAFTGKLQSAQLVYEGETYTITAEKYGGCTIGIDSPSLQELLRSYTA